MSNIPPSESVETFMADRPKGLRGIGSLGMVICASVRRGCMAAAPARVAASPRVADLFKNSRRLDFPILFFCDDMTYTSMDICYLDWVSGSVRRPAPRSKTGSNLYRRVMISAGASRRVSPFSIKKRNSDLTLNPWRKADSSSSRVFP